jgi:hypothetical protein
MYVIVDMHGVEHGRFGTMLEADQTMGENGWHHDDYEIVPEDEVEMTEVCDLCYRPIPRQVGTALCKKCEATMKAHARHEQARTEWERDGRPD